MNENDVERLLKKALFSEIGPDPSEEMIDAYLRSQEDNSIETISRVKKRFVEKMFLDVNPEILRQAPTNVTFGDFLEIQRNRAGVRREQLSYAVGIPAEQVDLLEKGRSKPWDFAPNIVADLMRVCRVHFELLKQLVETTAAVGEVRGVGPVAARSKGGKMTTDRGDSTSRALERFFARNATRNEPKKEAVDWLSSLEDFLREDEEHKELI